MRTGREVREEAMEFTEVVRKRRMVRNFTDEPLPPEAIERIMDLARHAPSAGFTQGQSFVVVTRPETKAEIAWLCGGEYYVERGFHPFVSASPFRARPCTNEAADHTQAHAGGEE